jgi:hypothetical protein
VIGARQGPAAADRPPDNRQGVETRSLFATPMAVAVLPGADSLNPVLKGMVLGLESEAKSLEGAWQSAWSVAPAKAAALQTVIEAACDLATGLTGDRARRRGTAQWRISWRATVLRRGQSLEIHGHPSHLWSATYFVDDGAAATAPGSGGELEFQDPRGVAPVMYAPNLTYAYPDGATLGVSQTLTPRAGALVVYPGWLLHGVAHYRGPGERISISLNLKARDPT